MPRRRQKEVNEATRQAIKEAARGLMAEKGTAGLSLRAIARQLDMTAPALYHYFDSLDDLITALIVDAFTSYAAAIRQSREAAAEQGATYSAQIVAAAHAYRRWALENIIDFQLIYGNPIPGYEAPAEVTTPAAQQIGQVFMEALVGALQAGEFEFAAPYREIPPEVAAHYREKYGLEGQMAEIFHVMNHAWSAMHGMVVLEVYNHARPVVGDTDAFYEQAIGNHFAALGMPMD